MRFLSRDHSSRHGRRSGAPRRARSLTLLAVLMFMMAFVGGPTTAAAAPPGECPDILPTADLEIGSLGRGWTVPVGDDPQPFRVEYLGVLEDGIAPGHDLIVIRVSDLPGRDFMTKAGGIWAGISGSPVYSNGDLVGAVAYSFGAGDAFVAGVTPAEEMARVLDYPGTAAAEPAGRERIALTPQLRAQLEWAGVDTADSESFERLSIPLAVSGLNQRARDRFQAYWDKQGIPVIVTPGSRAATPMGDSFGTARPGGNFAALLAFGDLTVGGIGTTTYVCGSQALAFGHPMIFSGKSSFGANDANAIGIIKTLFGSFKMANIAAPLGIVDQDRLTAIRGELGVAPTVIPVTSEVTNTDLDVAREGHTDVTMGRYVPIVAANHLISNFDTVFDAIGKGSARLDWTIHGSRANGDPFTLERGDRYASSFDITFASVNDLFNDLSAIFRNPFERVSFTSVDFTARVKKKFKPYTVASAKISKNGGPFKKRMQIQLHPGDTLVVRAALRLYRGDLVKVDLALAVPADAEPGGGQLLIGHFTGSGSSATDFDELLAELASQPRNDDLRARIVVFGSTGETEIDSAQRRVDNVVSGSIAVNVSIE